MDVAPLLHLQHAGAGVLESEREAAERGDAGEVAGPDAARRCAVGALRPGGDDMTGQTTPGEQGERWALVLRKPYPDGTESRICIYGYPSEEVAQQDSAIWAAKPGYSSYGDRRVVRESAVRALVDREGRS
jgi:hypothetical protein